MEIIQRAQERGEINLALNADAVAQAMLSLVHGLVLQKAWDKGVDVWRYVVVAKAMLTGSFWLGRRAGGGDVGDAP